MLHLHGVLQLYHGFDKQPNNNQFFEVLNQGQEFKFLHSSISFDTPNQNLTLCHTEM